MRALTMDEVEFVSGGLNGETVYVYGRTRFGGAITFISDEEDGGGEGGGTPIPLPSTDTIEKVRDFFLSWGMNWKVNDLLNKHTVAFSTKVSSNESSVTIKADDGFIYVATDKMNDGNYDILQRIDPTNNGVLYWHPDGVDGGTWSTVPFNGFN